MLNVYYGRHNIPKNKVFVFDVCLIGGCVDLQKDAFTKRVLWELDAARAVSKDRFVDKFGGGLYSKDLSTSTKILLMIHQTEYVANGFELGVNGYRILEEMDHGNILLNSRSFDLHPKTFPIAINGLVCNNRQEFNNTLLEVYADAST